MRPYPNTPTAAERKRHTLAKLTQAAAAAAFSLAAAAVLLLTIALYA